MKKPLLFLTFSLLFSLSLTAQNSPVGVWKSIDDKTGEARSHIEIYKNGSSYYGKIIKLLNPDEPNPLCNQCDGDRKDQPIIGMIIVEDMKPKDDYWKGGRILDPETGNTYRCSFWFEDGNREELKVRGKHWTGLYRTQTWYKVK